MAATSGGRMPLLDHFRELRSRVVKSALAITLGSLIGWFFYNEIITKLAEPVCDLRAAQESGAASCGALYINGVLGPLNHHYRSTLALSIVGIYRTSSPP
jgi:sec-independent protein translocase protein TatC